MSKTDRVTVDSGTQAGSHVPVGDFFNISMIFLLNCQTTDKSEVGGQ
jgi:hypothetical protein